MSPKKKEVLNRDFYSGDNAEFYTESHWMARNQIKTSSRILELLEDTRIGGEFNKEYDNMTILDLGCGSGYSNIIFRDLGFRVIGVDYSWDMLKKNINLKNYVKRSEQQEKENSKDHLGKLNPILINGTIENLPFRPDSIEIIISISAFNFILDNIISVHEKKELLSHISKHLSQLLKESGRVAIEFYPNKKDIDLYLEAFTKNFTGGLIIDNPGLRKEQKFLILKSKT